MIMSYHSVTRYRYVLWLEPRIFQWDRASVSYPYSQDSSISAFRLRREYLGVFAVETRFHKYFNRERDWIIKYYIVPHWNMTVWTQTIRSFMNINYTFYEFKIFQCAFNLHRFSISSYRFHNKPWNIFCHIIEYPYSHIVSRINRCN